MVRQFLGFVLCQSVLKSATKISIIIAHVADVTLALGMCFR